LQYLDKVNLRQMFVRRPTETIRMDDLMQPFVPSLPCAYRMLRKIRAYCRPRLIPFKYSDFRSNNKDFDAGLLCNLAPAVAQE